MQQNDVRAILKSLFPLGDEDLYAWDNPQSRVSRELEAITTAVRVKGTDAIDQIRQEFRPHTSTEKLVDWERVFGIAKSSTAAYGALDTRRGQIMARFRESGASTDPNIQAAFAAVLGYQPQIIERSRSALTDAHTYSFGGLPDTIPVGPGGVLSVTVNVGENAPVSQAGAVVRVIVSHVSPTLLSFRLTGPDGTAIDVLGAQLFGAGAAVSALRLAWFPGFAGKQCNGTWTLRVTNNSVVAGTLFGNVTGSGATSLFVEGIGRGAAGSEGLGSGIFEWAVLVNPALLGPAADLEAARALIQRWNPAHCRGYLCRHATVSGGGSASAIFDDPNAAFDECLFGT